MRKSPYSSRWGVLLLVLCSAAVCVSRPASAGDDADPTESDGDYLGVPEIAGLSFIRLNEFGAEEWLRKIDGAVVIRVPGGTYLKRPYEGAGEFLDPKPVEVKSFFIDKTEVTNEQFARYMPEHPGPPPADGSDGPPVDPVYGNTDDFDAIALARAQVPTYVYRVKPERARYPVTAATGFGARAYAKWVGGRLPTVNEWEKAAGGPEGRVYPWGDAKPDASKANFARPRPKGTLPVGSVYGGASPYGALDMAGNVYERVSMPGREGPVVIKGGSWLSPHPLNLRVLDMCVQPMGASEGSVGFRVVMADPHPDRPMITRRDVPALRLRNDFSEAVEEAQARNVPLFLSLQYDTCGQCDRVRMGLFRDPRFVAYANEHLVVLVGHDPGDAALASLGDRESPELYPGLERFELQSIFRRGIKTVGTFSVSPGNFVLDPHGIGEGRAAILVDEWSLPKSGRQVDTYLAAFAAALERMKERYGPVRPLPVVPDREEDDG